METSSRNTEQILNAIYYAALLDHNEGVAEWEPQRNSGPALERKLDLKRFRPMPRRGDSHKYRLMYMTCRFMIKTDNKEETDETIR